MGTSPTVEEAVVRSYNTGNTGGVLPGDLGRRQGGGGGVRGGGGLQIRA